MRLPDLVAYQAAVQHPGTAFGDADLRAATVTTTRLGLPRVAAGNFALTYQLTQGGRRWAVRCFHRDAIDRAKRYAAISQTLATLRVGPLVALAYLPGGLRVLAQTPNLWRTYNTDDNLLFRRTDFVTPDASALFRDLRAQPATRDLAERFARVCQSDYALVPTVADFLQVKVQPRPVATTLRIGDLVTLNRLYNPTRNRTLRRSWSIRRAAAQVALTFTPDGLLLATAESTRKVRLRETASGRVHHVWTNPTQITCMACSADGRQVFGSGPDGTLSIWPLTARGVAHHLVTPRGTLRGLASGPNGPLVAVGTGHTVHLVEPTTGRRLTLNAGRDVTCLAF